MDRPVETFFSARHLLPDEGAVMTGNDTPLLPSSDLSPRIGETIIRSVTEEGVPLLVAENRGNGEIPSEILSAMLVPMTVREKVFGILTAEVTDGQKEFDEKDLYYLSFLSRRAANAVENLALYENIYENLFATLYAFVKAIGARDSYTEEHSKRVAAVSVAIGENLGCTREEIDILNFSGHLHDIGKIGIPDHILNKPSKLTDEEFAKIKEHPDIGASIFERLGLWESEKQIIRWHHERYDGSGYPDGLKKDDIPLLARILSVADAFDSLASTRTYREKVEEKEILNIMRDSSGSQFDPIIVEAFFKAHQKGMI
jgi:putative nucleotidyltransferase with HDIG domain